MTANITYKLAIVVPCYNEGNRLPIQQFKSFTKCNKDILICLVNDGSKDNTQSVLTQLEEDHPNTITQISLHQNSGKAEAVRQGVLYCLENNHFDKIAYLDADLATSLEECVRVSNFVKNEIVFAFGSRVSKVDNKIERKFYRFCIGRCIATLISAQLKLRVYDTQCGCKVFDKKIVSTIFKAPFISKWLFDVEIFHRIIALFGRKKTPKITKEIPLKAWVDTCDSRVEFNYFFKMWGDLFAIGKQYKN